jgi:hypothetical protein
MMSTIREDEICVGMRFGRLVVCGEPYMRWFRKSVSRRYCPCRCDCGNEKDVVAYNLRNGNTQSCGCLQRERTGSATRKHGGAGTRIFIIYGNMKSRCLNPKNGAFHRYGGRGIKVCDEWLDDFVAFREWALSHGYRDDLTIERIDVNGNYTPENCTWIPLAEQALNTTCNIRFSAFGETKSLIEWARDPRCVVPYMSAYNRLRDGWEIEAAIITPLMIKYRSNKKI